MGSADIKWLQVSIDSKATRGRRVRVEDARGASTAYWAELISHRTPNMNNTLERHLIANPNIGEIGVFVSGFLLSLGGCIAIMASSIRRSRCNSISFLGFRCVRTPVDDPDPAV
jgi:hypothetical protein